MTPFGYTAAPDLPAALARVRENAGASYIAGGTDLIQLLQDNVATPDELVDINHLPLRGISVALDGIRIGALTSLSDTADDLTVRERLPVVAEALRDTASPQVRNMATVGGNLLQRTRCLYFRDVATPCNKRLPGSGCPAQQGQNRINAILGGSPHCIAVHPSDLAVALVALDAEAVVRDGDTERTIRIEDLYRLPGETPHIETELKQDEIITGIWIPLDAAAMRSHYLKVRNRASFEWAMASCAVALALDDDQIIEARLAVGGVATKPWRLRQLENDLTGKILDAQLIAEVSERAADGAEPRGRNAFKIPLLKRTVARALETLRSRL